MTGIDPAAGGPSGRGVREGRPAARPDRSARGPHGREAAARDTAAVRVAAAVLALPYVAELDGGPFGTVASHLPGRRRVLGVRLHGGPDGIHTVEVSVVARLGPPLPRLAADVAAAVRGVLGEVAVDVTFADVVPAVTAVPPGRPAGP